MIIRLTSFPKNDICSLFHEYLLEHFEFLSEVNFLEISHLEL